MAGGIFCIENWSGDLRSPETVLPILAFLESHGSARVIHQRVSTTQELAYYLQRFAHDLNSYKVGYLALHGERGSVFVGSEPIDLEKLVEWSSGKESTATARALLPEAASRLSGSSICAARCCISVAARALVFRDGEFPSSERRLAQLRFVVTRALLIGMSQPDSRSCFCRLWRRPLMESEKVSVRPSSGCVGVRGDLLDSLGFICEPDWRP